MSYETMQQAGYEFIRKDEKNRRIFVEKYQH